MLDALGFLTVFGRPRRPTPATTFWFPIVGLVIGALLGGVWYLADHAFSPGLAAAIVIAADLVVTGMLHLDGLADSADGLLPHLERARRLEVMATPDVGAFGVGVVALVVLVRYSSIVDAFPSWKMFPVIWCASRSAMVGVMCLPYARPGGLVEAFRGPANEFTAGGGLGIALALGWFAEGLHGLLAVVAVAATAALVAGLSYRRLRGFTGDVLGAVAILGETAGLVAVNWRWK